MSDLVLKNIIKRFSKTVLNNIYLTIKKGEFVSIVGPSGSGKTTLLRCIAGLETLTEGSISFNERSFDSLPTQKRNLSMVLQQTTLFPQMTVAENIRFSLKNQKTPKKIMQEKIKWASNFLQIVPLLDCFPNQLSGGEQQRVALARAMVKESSLLLLDEPFSSLDSSIKKNIQNKMKQIHQETKKTILFITHDQMEAMSLSDRIAVMYCGEILQIDTPSQIYRFPKTHFVAEFMGEWGIYVWERRSKKEDTFSKHFLFDTVSFSFSISSYYSKAVSLGIRPEHLQMTEKKIKNLIFLFEVVMDKVEFLGSRQKVYFNLEHQSFFAVVSSNILFNENSRYFVSVRKEDVLFFDETKKTILFNCKYPIDD